jgi:hypothetical protein
MPRVGVISPVVINLLCKQFGQGVWRGHWAGDLQKDNGVIRRVDWLPDGLESTLYVVFV